MTTTGLQGLLTVEEVATALRKTKKAVYAMVARRQLPGAFRVGRHLLVRQDVLAAWLAAKGSLLPDATITGPAVATDDPDSTSSST